MRLFNLLFGIFAAVLFTISVYPDFSFAQSMDKKYKTVYVERVINAPAHRVWEAMVLDYGEISNFQPSVFASNYAAGSLKGELGAERKCSYNEKGSRWVHERIAAIDNENMVMRNVPIDGAKFPLDFDNTQAFYRVKDNGDGTATASYEFQYRAKPAFMGGFMKGRFRKLLEDTLIGLDHYLTTGEIVNATTGNWKEIKKKYKEAS